MRSSAVAVCTVFVWGTDFLSTLTFLPLVQAVGQGGTFVLYAIICVLSFAFATFLVPETKGRSLEDIEQALRRPTGT